jgi:RNA polymerase sigma-70 factor (ECF subfamily)
MKDEDGRSHWPALMAAAQDGDQQAYRTLLRAMVPAVRAMVRRRISDPALIEDVIQDVLLTTHRMRNSYDPARPFMPWIAAIASARAIDALRRRGRTYRREINDDMAFANHIDPAAHPIEALAAQSEVTRLLDTLLPRQRHVVELVKLREMSLDEAAKASSLSVPVLKTVLHRALTKLRRQKEICDD